MELQATEPCWSASGSPRCLAKRLRNLRKKLREIATLEKEPRRLLAEAKQKVARRAGVEAEIADLVGALVVLQESRSIANQDVWEKATATPVTATPVDSNRSNSQSDCDKANSTDHSGSPSCPVDSCADSGNQGSAHQLMRSHSLDSSDDEVRTEQALDAPINHPTLIDIDVNIGKESTCFRVPEHFQLIKSLGSGSYGSVAAFWDTKHNYRVAVKKVANAFSELPGGMRALREVRVLSSTDHDNIVKMRYFYCDRRSGHDDLYIIQERADIDLHSVIKRSGQHLTEKHHRHILYGITRGLAYLHDVDVAHRDLKPANILVNTDCSVKICDFNLSRGGMQFHSSTAAERAFAEQSELSDYVCTRWYRAPELMLFKGRYGKSVDVWSLGCIVCELISSKPVFKGANTSGQIRQIISTIGYPKPEDLHGRIFQSGAQKLLRGLSDVFGKPWHVVLPGASCEVLNIIAELLQFSPEKRITANECLRQAYFFRIHRQAHESTTNAAMDWSFDELGCTRSQLRELLCEEGCAFVELDTTPALPETGTIPHGMAWADVEDYE